jgi:predicted DNA-binding protein
MLKEVRGSLKTEKITMKTKIKRIPVAERTNVQVGKSSEIPDRVMTSYRLKVETKQQLEDLSSRLGISMTVIVETIVDYFAHTSDSEAARIRLQTKKDSLQKRIAETNEELKKLDLRVDL